MAGLYKFIKGLSSLIVIVGGAIFVGPILSASNYAIKPSPIAMSSVPSGLTSHGVLISITVGLADIIIYGIGLGTSIQAANELHRQQTAATSINLNAVNKQVQSELADYHKRLQSIIAQEKQLLQPLTETAQLANAAQASVRSLHEVIKTILSHNDSGEMDLELKKTVDEKLLAIENQNKIDPNKAEALKSLMSKIGDELKGLESVRPESPAQADATPAGTASDGAFSLVDRPLKDHFIDSTISNRQLFGQIYLFIFAFSFLIYLHNIVLWILQYLSMRNFHRWSPLSVVIALIIIGQSSALIFLLHMTNAFRFLSPLYVYTVLFLVRSLVEIRHYASAIQ